MYSRHTGHSIIERMLLFRPGAFATMDSSLRRGRLAAGSDPVADCCELTGGVAATRIFIYKCVK